ncbi:MAG TPA: hypothetical protein VGM86_34050 [Thermoanaerobaculia bacterium]|jgi:hypothetical protein
MQLRNVPFPRRWPFAAGRTDLHLLRQQQQPPGFAFPGAGSIAQEFPDPQDRAGLAKIHEGVISAGMLALTALGYALSRTRPDAD